jgi:uncharacterized protein (TIGR02996 family)
MREDNFLQMVVESPDDAPRLVYADWLDEQGRAERAELIRVQCRLRVLAGEAGRLRDEAARDEGRRREPASRGGWLERLSFAIGPPPCGEELTLRRRAAELIAAHGREWFGRLPLDGWFSRGLPAGVYVTLPQLLEHAAALRALALHALSLDLYGGQPPSTHGRRRMYQWQELLGPTGVFDRCEDLFVSCLPEGRDDLMDVGLMPRLRRLVVPGEKMPFHPPSTKEVRGELAWYETTGWRLNVDTEPGWADEIFGNDVLAGLRGPTLDYLDYSDNNLGDAGVTALAGSTNMASLRTLRLNWSDMGAAGLDALGRSPHLANLRHLDLGFNPDFLDEEALEALLATPLPGRLRLLDVSHALASEALITRLVESPAAAGLAVLAVGPTSSQAEQWRSGRVVRALAESPHLRGLRWLNLQDVPLDDDLVLALARSRTLERLHTLELWCWPEPTPGAARRELEGRYRVLWNGAPPVE